MPYVFSLHLQASWVTLTHSHDYVSVRRRLWVSDPGGGLEMKKEKTSGI